MGVFDKFKEVVGDVAGGVADVATHPTTVLKQTAKWSPPGIVGRYAVQPAIKAGWNNSIGEMGDRDYNPMDEGAVQQAAALQAQQQQTLFGQPANAVAPVSAPGPLAQRGIDMGKSDLFDYMEPFRTGERPRVDLLNDLYNTYPEAHRSPLSQMMANQRFGRQEFEQYQAEMERGISERFDSDIATLLDEQKSNDTIQDYKTITQTLLQVFENAHDDNGAVTDQESRDGVMALLNQNYEDLQPHFEALAPGWWDENFEFYEGDSAFARKSKGIAAPILEAFDQFAKHQLQGVENIFLEIQDQMDGGQRVTFGVPESLGEAWKGDDEGAPTTIWEAFGMDPEWGGEWGDWLDVAAQIGIDPTTYISIGVSPAVKSGIQGTARVIARKYTGDVLSEAIQRHQRIWHQIQGNLDGTAKGWASLADGDREWMESLIKLQAHDMAKIANGGLTGKAREAASKLMKRNLDDAARLESKAQQIAQKNIGKIDAQGLGGFRMAGHRLPGLKNRKMPSILGDTFEHQSGSRLVDSGESKTFRRAEDFIDTETTTRWKATPGKVTESGGFVDESLDPRISKLRNKAADSAVGPDEAAAFTAKADELADRLRKGDKTAFQDIDWVEETITRNIKKTRWIDETVPLLKEEVWSELIKRPGFLSKLRDGKRLMSVRRRLVPRARAEVRIGRAHSDAVYGQIVEAQGRASRASKDAVSRLQGKKVYRSAVAAAGGEEELARLLSQAMSDPESFGAIYAVAPKPVRNVMDALQDIRNQIWDTLDPADQAMFDKDSYIPRQFTKEGQEWLDKIATSPRLQALLEEHAPGLYNIAQERATDRTNPVSGSVKDAFKEKRGMFYKTQDLFELNKNVQGFFQEMGIEGPEQLFSTDILSNYAVRTESAFQAKVFDEIASGLAALGTDVGEAIFVHKANLGTMGNRFDLVEHAAFPDYLVDKSLVPDLDGLLNVINNPAALDGLRGVSDYMNGMWARYATLSPGFHARNAMGNVFNAFLGGLTNPAHYVDAMFLQRVNNKARKIMESTGVSFDEAVSDLRTWGVKINDADALLIGQMLEHQILTGQVGDVFKETHQEKFSREEFLDPKSQSALNPTMASRKLGNLIEHNARAALFIDASRKGMDAASAAAHVRTHLFDYNDLTQWEQGVRRHASRFYTFMRKNTALQVNTLARAPGRIANAERIIDRFVEQMFGEADESQEGIPGWAAVAGMERRGGNAVGIETPFRTGMNTLEDLMALPLALAEQFGAPIDRLPNSVEDAIAYGNVQDKYGQFLGLFSGLPKAAIDTVYGQATGYDPFSGAIVGYDNNRRKERWGWGWLEPLATLNPMISRLQRYAEDAVLTGIADGDGIVDAMVSPFVGDERREKLEEDRENFGDQDIQLTLANILGGVQVYEDAKIQQSAVNTLKFDMGRVLEMQREEHGDDWMTMEDLYEYGRIDTVNRFMNIMAYSDTVTPEGKAELASKMAGLVPKAILEMYVNAGILPEDVLTERKYSNLARPQDDMQAAQQSLVESQMALEEMLGRPLRKMELINLVQASGMAPWMSEQEELGIEGLRDYGDPETNVFTKDDVEPDPRDDPYQLLTQLGGAVGLTVEDMQMFKPIQTDMSRLEEQAFLAGKSDAELEQYILREVWSRTDINVVLGEDALSTHNWNGFDDKDYAKQVNAAAQDAATLRWWWFYKTGTQIPEASLKRMVEHMSIGRTDQKYLIEGGLMGDLGPYPPSRENIQSKQEQANDAGKEWQAVQEGLFGPGLWQGPIPEADERKSIQLGGSDAIYGTNRFAEAPSWMESN